MTESLRSIQQGPAQPERILVILPGYGDRPEKFIERIKQFDPDAQWLVIVVEPHQLTELGPIWYEVDENGPDPVALATAIGAIRETCQASLAANNLDPASLVLCGFSQGGALALATALDPASSLSPSAVAVLAGYLPHRDGMSLELANNLPMLFVHGSDDDMVEIIRGRSAAKTVHRAGAIVSWSEVHSGHYFDGELLTPLRHWLSAIAAGETPYAPPI